MPKYFREVNKHFSGDKTLAARYMGVARSLLGCLVEMSGGVFQNSRNVVLPDGAKISVSFAGQIASVSIDVSSKVSAVVSGYCDRFMSGIVSVAETVMREIDGIDVNKLRWFYPSAYEQEVSEIGPERIESKEFQDRYVTITNCFATSYSGDMRKAIQLMLGMNMDLVTDLGMFGKRYKYNFGFDGTNGLVRAFGYTDEKPAYWLIKMPEHGHGVLAKKFAVCSDVTDIQRDNGVHWVPLGTDFGGDIDAQLVSGDVIELVSIDAFNEAIDGFSYTYPDCGWAFSSSGHECQNVLIGSEDDVCKTMRVIVSFSVSEARIEASISNLGKEVFVGPLASLPRVPYITSLYSSLLPINEASTLSNPSYTGITDCAVHVYYDGDEECVVRYNYEPGSVSTINSGNYWNGAYALGVPGISPVSGVYTGDTFNSGTTKTSYSVSGSTVNTNEFTGGGVEYGFEIELTEFPGCPYSFVPNAGNHDAFFVLNDINTKNSYSRSYDQKTNFVVLLVPFWQREGVYVLDATRNQYGPYTNYVGPYYRSSLKAENVTIVNSRISAECPSGDYFAIDSRTYGDYIIDINHYTSDTTPQIKAYAYLYGGNGDATAPIGCYASITSGCGGSLTRPSPGTPIFTTSTDEWRGDLIYIGPECHVRMSLGVSSVADPNNLVKAKVLGIYSTAYITNGTSQYITAWTDAFRQEKYVVCNNINTALGENVVSNTGYDFSDMDTIIRSFVGIAN